jgi:hypothetical protein
VLPLVPTQVGRSELAESLQWLMSNPGQGSAIGSADYWAGCNFRRLRHPTGKKAQAVKSVKKEK